MKKQIFGILTVITLAIASCTGNKADKGADKDRMQDDSIKYSQDNASQDSTAQQAPADSGSTTSPKPMQ